MLTPAQVESLGQILAGLDTSKDIVELCGPTPDGYRLLATYQLSLPKAPLTSNVTNPIVLNPYGEKPDERQVDLVVDIRDMPFADNSLAMLLASYPPLTSDAHLGIGWRWLRRRVSEARLWFAKRDARHGTITSRRNMHIAMLREANRCLVPRGVFLFQGPWPEDIANAERLGFTILLDDTASGGTDSVLLQK